MLRVKKATPVHNREKKGDVYATMTTNHTEIHIQSFYEDTHFDIQIVVKDNEGKLRSSEFIDTFKTLEEATEAAREKLQEYPESPIVRVEGVE